MVPQRPLNDGNTFDGMLNSKMVPPSKIVVGDKAMREDANIQYEELEPMLADDDRTMEGSLPGFGMFSMEVRDVGSMK